jgi:alpha-amylase/alpha-mannosidase (GH57 family)
VLAPDGSVASQRDNYRSLSLDVGPTLAAWLEPHAPDVHAAIVAADGAGGRAIAHPWAHAILPLCTERDRRTLVHWGVADFRRRFGREPAGVWLPETAVDLPTLETLADEGLAFTILAPHQLALSRTAVGAGWSPEIDPRVPHRVALPSGRSVSVLTYDGALSNAVAFEGLLEDGVQLATRVLDAAGPGDGPALAAVVTDFETYGHHHRFGEMALAKALGLLEAEPGVAVVTAAEAIAAVPARDAVLAEHTAWSCAHGVGRWRADCGCRVGPPTPHGQAWRAPLRLAVDWLRDTVAQLEELATDLADPRAARDAYGSVLTGAEPWTEWVGSRLARGGSGERARTWLEAQRHVLLMQSSCGWFFDDAAGHETALVLRHAARAAELVATLGGPDLEPRLVELLRPMRSEDPRYPDGAAIWRELVRTRSGRHERRGAHRPG